MSAFVRITLENGGNTFIDCDLDQMTAVKHLPDGTLTIAIHGFDLFRVTKPDEIKRVMDYVEAHQFGR